MVVEMNSEHDEARRRITTLQEEPVREEGRGYFPMPCAGCRFLRETRGTAGYVKHYVACGWWDDPSRHPIVGASNIHAISEVDIGIPRVGVEGPHVPGMEPPVCPVREEAPPQPDQKKEPPGPARSMIHKKK